MGTTKLLGALARRSENGILLAFTFLTTGDLRRTNWLASVVRIFSDTRRKDFFNFRARFLSHQTRDYLIFGVR